VFLLKERYHSNMNEIPVVILDWDYDTFSITDDNNFVIYDAPDVDLIFIEGWPWPGKSIPQTLAKRVAPFTYQLITPIPPEIVAVS